MTQVQSTKEFNKDDFLRLYKSLTDPTIKEENKRKADRAKRMELKKQDYGL